MNSEELIVNSKTLRVLKGSSFKLTNQQTRLKLVSKPKR